MDLTLRKVIESTPLKDTKILAGGDYLDRAVIGANIIEVPDVSKWMKGGEILFTTGYAFSGSNEKGCKLIENLAANKIAALAIKPGQYLKEIPNEMIECAEKNHLPLFELSENNPYMFYMQPIYEEIINEKALELNKVTEFHEILLKAQIEGGLEKICDTYSRLINKDIYLADNSGIINYSSRFENKHDFQNVLTTCIHEGVEIKETQIFHKQHDDKSIGIAVSPLHLKGTRILGYLVINLLENNSKTLTFLETTEMNYAVTLISLEILNKQEIYRKEQRVRGDLLDDLLRENYEDKELIYRRAKFISFDLTLPFLIFTIGVTEKNNILKSVPSDELSIVKSELILTVERQLSTLKIVSMCLEKNSGIVSMVCFRSQSEKNSVNTIVNVTVNHFRNKYKNFSFFAGFGRVYKQISKVPTSYSQAKLAQRVGNKLYSDKQFTTFDSLGVLRFLYELKDSPAMLEFYHENMDKLIEYDKQNNSDLIKTLVFYFANEGNLRLTADALFVHKNSVVYRIKKIENILEKSLRDVNTSLDLQICLKIKEIIK